MKKMKKSWILFIFAIISFFFLVFLVCVKQRVENFTLPLDIIDLDDSLFEDEHAFNPSILFFQDGHFSNVVDSTTLGVPFLMSYRTQSTLKDEPYINLIIKNNNFLYDDKVLIDESNTKYNDDGKRYRYEDARFCILKGEAFFIYSYYDKQDQEGTIKQVITAYKDISHSIELTGVVSTNKEKNWILFDLNQSMYMIYRLFPECIMYSIDDTFQANLMKQKKYGAHDEIRGGTSPICIENYLYFFGHGYPRRIPSVVVMEKSTFEIVGYCHDLLKNYNSFNSFVYCRGALFVTSLNRFILSVGIDDTYCKLIFMDKDYVDQSLTWL